MTKTINLDPELVRALHKRRGPVGVISIVSLLHQDNDNFDDGDGDGDDDDQQHHHQVCFRSLPLLNLPIHNNHGGHGTGAGSTTTTTSTATAASAAVSVIALECEGHNNNNNNTDPQILTLVLSIAKVVVVFVDGQSDLRLVDQALHPSSSPKEHDPTIFIWINDVSASRREKDDLIFRGGNFHTEFFSFSSKDYFFESDVIRSKLHRLSSSLIEPSDRSGFCLNGDEILNFLLTPGWGPDNVPSRDKLILLRKNQHHVAIGLYIYADALRRRENYSPKALLCTAQKIVLKIVEKLQFSESQKTLFYSELGYGPLSDSTSEISVVKGSLISPCLQLFASDRGGFGCKIFADVLSRSQRRLEKEIFRRGGQKYIEEIGTKLVPRVKYFHSCTSVTQVIHKFRTDFERCWNGFSDSPVYKEVCQWVPDAMPRFLVRRQKLFQLGCVLIYQEYDQQLRYLAQRVAALGSPNSVSSPPSPAASPLSPTPILSPPSLPAMHGFSSTPHFEEDDSFSPWNSGDPLFQHSRDPSSSTAPRTRPSRGIEDEILKYLNSIERQFFTNLNRIVSSTELDAEPHAGPAGSSDMSTSGGNDPFSLNDIHLKITLIRMNIHNFLEKKKIKRELEKAVQIMFEGVWETLRSKVERFDQSLFTLSHLLDVFDDEYILLYIDDKKKEQRELPQNHLELVVHHLRQIMEDVREPHLKLQFLHEKVFGTREFVRFLEQYGISDDCRHHLTALLLIRAKCRHLFSEYAALACLCPVEKFSMYQAERASQNLNLPLPLTAQHGVWPQVLRQLFMGINKLLSLPNPTTSAQTQRSMFRDVGRSSSAEDEIQSSSRDDSEDKFEDIDSWDIAEAATSTTNNTTEVAWNLKCPPRRADSCPLKIPPSPTPTAAVS